jgi:hypothetical protein
MRYQTLKQAERKVIEFDNWRDAYNYFKTAKISTRASDAFRAKYDIWGDKLPSQAFEDMFKIVKGEVLIEYSRKPTQGEIRFGHGARHYADFNAYECLKPNGRYKKRLKGDDGLIYTRG